MEIKHTFSKINIHHLLIRFNSTKMNKQTSIALKSFISINEFNCQHIFYLYEPNISRVNNLL